MINLQATAACGFVFVIQGNPEFYKNFGYSISQFKALTNRDKLEHLMNKMGRIAGLKPKLLPKGNLDQLLKAYPVVDYQPIVGKEGVELHFKLKPLASNVRLRADRSTGKGAGAVIISAASKRCLWVKRSMDSEAPGTWANLGGGVDLGETIVQGLRRELYEEGGIDQQIAFTPFYKSIQPNFTYYNFVGVVADEFDPVLNDEHTDFVWSVKIPQPAHPKLAEALRHPNFTRVYSKLTGVT